MKKMRIEGYNLIGYIQHQDVSMLVSIKDFIKPELFEEESILKGECDEEGYYRISNLSNVHYVKGLKFIPNYDYLLKLNNDELDVLVESTNNQLSFLRDFLSRVCNSKETTILEEEKSMLKNIDIIDQAMVDILLDSSEFKTLRYRQIAFYIQQQLQHYLYALVAVNEYKKSIVEHDTSDKSFSLKRLFKAKNKDKK